MKSINVIKVYAIIMAALLAIDIGSAVLIDDHSKTAIAQSVKTGDAANMFIADAGTVSFDTQAGPAAEASPSPLPAATEEKHRAYSESDKILIAKVVYAESRGEPFEGQVAVATVVINRFESGKFGKTIRKVVYAKNQFAVGKRYNKQNMEAVEAAIAGNDYPPNMFYFRTSKSHHWRNFIYYCRIGHHSFYLGR